MISANTKNQVISWSQRQLGSGAGLASVSDHDCMDAVDLVEKDGTGIRAMDAQECQPVLSIMATMIRDLPSADNEYLESLSHYRGEGLQGRKPVLH